jgi:hypothetical protein
MPCVFCGHPKRTNEHVFPQWLLGVIPGHGPIVHRGDAPPGSVAESREWTTDVITFKAKVVCARTCNNGWMNDLEKAARPFLESMIGGYGRTLYDRGRTVVAYWGLKTAMMIDFAQEPEHRSVRASDYPSLYKRQGVLPNTFVWLAASRFGRGALARNRTLTANLGTKRLEGFGATLNVGHLVIEVVRLDGEPVNAIDIGGKLGPGLQRIWPASRPVTWTPALQLDRQHVAWLGQMIEQSPLVVAPE